ncbi:MAG TPA: 23S rRNA (pseudouridine(1915)-N(3))-methyltransferase RlmH [Ideonella sp.]|uniref:23S rRNA (pseudouridine(1915)-N(3))-methyltransferase RlmH n=1 Tax=Ideonella sp. TaxID=1929293 RepID=UPI002B913FC1|nr:23S rRNA (pseudouridine(1915)-N(3))-methyltransferase RlmH [Ideonella sp.]HSI52220.1 23S rRNA (pseudouridine(1915)-N(3))-methyltransferase RlmH [Ideonella sp.]
MRLVLAAVGQRQPAWADAAYEDFAKRFPSDAKLELKAVKAEPRGGKSTEQLMAAEASRLEAACPKGARRVILDERGARMTTAELAKRFEFWLGDGRDVVFFVGGPDGLDPTLKATADETLRLSDLTLPHAFVRVFLAEALYRAWSLRNGHPYHRE